MLDIHHLIAYFSKAPIQYQDLFIKCLPAHSVDTNRRTAALRNGLVFTLRGNAIFSLNGAPYEANIHTVIHAGPSMEIKMETASTDWEYVVVHYQSLHEKSPLYEQHFSISCTEHKKLQSFLQKLIKYDQLPGSLMQMKCQVILYQLIEHLLIHAKIQTASNFIDAAISYINAHFREQLSVAEIAQIVDCDRRRFAYLFEKQVGLSPIQYLTEYRLKQAKQLLQATNIPINEISLNVGYIDPYYFCKLFKKHYHCTPTQYRKSL
jgi:AraC-like DNA-binding protein